MSRCCHFAAQKLTPATFRATAIAWLSTLLPQASNTRLHVVFDVQTTCPLGDDLLNAIHRLGPHPIFPCVLP